MNTQCSSLLNRVRKVQNDLRTFQEQWKNETFLDNPANILEIKSILKIRPMQDFRKCSKAFLKDFRKAQLSAFIDLIRINNQFYAAAKALSEEFDRTAAFPAIKTDALDIHAFHGDLKKMQDESRLTHEEFVGTAETFFKVVSDTDRSFRKRFERAKTVPPVAADAALGIIISHFPEMVTRKMAVAENLLRYGKVLTISSESQDVEEVFAIASSLIDEQDERLENWSWEVGKGDYPVSAYALPAQACQIA